MGGAINLVSPQADQGSRARRPRRRRVRRRLRLHGPVELLCVRRHAAEGLLRADQRHHRRPRPLRHVERFHAVGPAPGVAGESRPTSRTRTAATATTRISRTGASTPRSASRRTPPTNTASTTRSSRARRTPRCTSIGRSCRAISIRATRSAGTALGLAALGHVERVLAVEDQLGEASYIKTNAYYNTFRHTVSFFTQPARTPINLTRQPLR